MLYRALTPILFRLDAERAHRLTTALLRRMRAGPVYAPKGPLAIRVAGIDFPNPIGLAAGFDKDAQVPDVMLRLGFGSVEVGSITPLPQAGNPQPRLFRLAADRAVINRMGFNNAGAQSALVRLRSRAARSLPGVVGVNIGANKDSPDRITDYAAMAEAMAPVASYVAINVSSPNTPGLRALQDPAALGELIDRVIAARGAAGPPIFLKVAPDLLPADIDAIARIAIDRRLGALIIANTTIGRPHGHHALQSAHADESGGLSGAPLKTLALTRLRDFHRATGGTMPLVGVGGIATAEDAWQRIRAGASLVQLYTAMVYQGPGVARTIARGLEKLMRRDGFTSIAEAVGTE